MKNFIPAFLAMTVAMSGFAAGSPAMAGEGGKCPHKEGCKNKIGKECKNKAKCNKGSADDCCKDHPESKVSGDSPADADKAPESK